MMHMLIRHKVADFAKWKPVYDAHAPSRQKAGLKEEHLLRSADDPNEVILLFSAEDLDKAVAGYLRDVLMSGPEAVAAAKTLVRTVHGRSAADAAATTATLIAQLRVSAEGRAMARRVETRDYRRLVRTGFLTSIFIR